MEDFAATRDLLRTIPHRNGVEPIMHSVEELRSFYGGGAADAMDESHVQYVQPLTPAAASQFPDFANTLAAPLLLDELHSEFQSGEMVGSSLNLSILSSPVPLPRSPAPTPSTSLLLSLSPSLSLSLPISFAPSLPLSC